MIALSESAEKQVLYIAELRNMDIEEVIRVALENLAQELFGTEEHEDEGCG